MELNSIPLLPVIEEIAKIGCYETNMTTGTWTGSDNFIKIFGLEKKPFYTVEEFQALVHPDDFDWVMAHFSDCLRKQLDFNCEYRCVKNNGETVYVNSRSKVYYSPEGTPLRVLGVKQDVTVSKLNEQRLSELYENSIKKNEILSIVAHDLKSPLSQLESLAYLMKQKLNAQFHDLILLQETICKSAHATLNEIIEIAELEDKRYVLKTTHTDINELIQRSVTTFNVMAAKKDIVIKTTLADECGAHVNAQKFSRMINNLLSNAIKFTSAGGKVEVVTNCFEDGFKVEVIDEGIGIHQDHIPLLFDKFSKVTRRPGTMGEKSTGLGLSIVKQIIDLHQGKITVRSREGQGTTFCMDFKMADTT
jgi:PAS domain S-box-containing protein